MFERMQVAENEPVADPALQVNWAVVPENPEYEHEP
jgi:hypothetical protein